MGLFTSKYKRMYENELKTNEALRSKNANLSSELGTLNNNISRQTDIVTKLKADKQILEQEKINLLENILKLEQYIIEKNNTIKYSDEERKKLTDIIYNLRSEVKYLKAEKEDLVNYITDNKTKAEECTNTCCCNGEICNETAEVAQCITENEIETKTEVIAEDSKREIKLTKSQIRKLKKQSK